MTEQIKETNYEIFLKTINSLKHSQGFYSRLAAQVDELNNEQKEQLKAELNESISKWITTDKEVEQQYKDVELIREKLSTREERYFELSNYFTIYNTDENTLKEDWKKFEQKIWLVFARESPRNFLPNTFFIKSILTTDFLCYNGGKYCKVRK